MPDVSGELAGLRVLITRPSGRGRGLADGIARLGGVADLRPTIAFAPPADRDAVTASAGGIVSYDWIVVTSPTGARYLDEALGARNVGSIRARLAAIGPGTARALERLGRAVDVVATRADADGLAASLVPQVRAGQRVLVVRPEVARPVVVDALRAAGAAVDPVPFYRTVAADDCAETAQAVLGGAYDIAVFSSPSTLHHLLDAAGDRRAALVEALADMRRIAIGAVTAAALDAAGIPATAVARNPTEDGVLEAIRKAN